MNFSFILERNQNVPLISRSKSKLDMLSHHAGTGSGPPVPGKRSDFKYKPVLSLLCNRQYLGDRGMYEQAGLMQGAETFHDTHSPEMQCVS